MSGLFGMFGSSTQNAVFSVGSAETRKDLKSLPSLEIKRRANRGDAHAQYFWAIILAATDTKKKGLGSDTADIVSHVWMEKAAKAGVPEAQLDIGRRYKRGSPMARDYVQAERYIQLAANQGLDEAVVALATLRYEQSEEPSAKADALRSLDSFLLDPKNRYSFPAYMNAELTLKRALIVRDFGDCWEPQSWSWLEHRARNGDIEASIIIAIQRTEHPKASDNQQETASFLLDAAKSGSGLAQNMLGDCYAEGRGVPQNEMVAHAWYNLASTSLSMPIAETAKANRAFLEESFSRDTILQAQNMALQMQAAMSVPASSGTSA